jgi:cytochrome c oxidase subunit II
VTAPRLGRAVAAIAGLTAIAGTAAACIHAPRTTQGEDIASLYTVFVAGGVIVAAIVWVLATWAIVRYRRRDDRLPPQTHGNLRIEAVWTAIPLIAVLGLFALTLRTLSAVDAIGPAGVNVHVTAFRWQWEVVYPDAGVRLTGTTGTPLEVVLPVGEPVHVTLDSLDVNHAFYVPAFLFKRDAIPGSPTTFELQVTAPGTYPGACAEFCGVGHSQMPFTIRGVDVATFQAWLTQQAAPSPAP